MMKEVVPPIQFTGSQQSQRRADVDQPLDDPADEIKRLQRSMNHLISLLALIALQQAQLLSAQRRVADDLDQRVAQRTAELAAANEELRKEIVQRKLAEERVIEEERELNRSEARKAAILDSALDCILT